MDVRTESTPMVEPRLLEIPPDGVKDHPDLRVWRRVRPERWLGEHPDWTVRDGNRWRLEELHRIANRRRRAEAL